MATYATKVAVRDSFDDDDVSDDVDDEVFIRDGRNGFKMDEEIGVKRPLMAPRRKHKPTKTHGDPNLRFGFNCRTCLAPCCIFLALAVLLGLITLAVVAVNFLPLPLDRIQFWKSGSLSSESRTIPCTDFAVNDVWTQTFPKLTSETPIRLNDINSDGVLDIIFGYGTGADGRNVPDFVCKLYFGRDPPCLGGVLAVDGKTGETVWQHWTQRPVFTLDCSADLTQDYINDCLIGGKGGLLHVVNGHDGSLLWHLEDVNQQQESEPVLDVYSAQYISDVDGDGFVDVVASHTATDTAGSDVKGQLILVSGKAGRLMRMLDTPGSAESYYAPQLLVRPDGESEILLGTGGTAGQPWGGVHAVPLSQLATADKLAAWSLLMSDPRGVMSPPVLADITRDGIEDIIISLFNSSVVAIDGLTFLPLWNYSFPNSETFSPPTPGFFNDDDIPDFLVKYQTGPDFPIYYYSQTNILDGKTGAPLLDVPVVDSVGSQMGGLSISMEGFGSDWFLYWTADCVDHERSQSPFSFVKGSSLVVQSRADLCHLRFNSSMSATLWAINHHVEPPGVALYSSEWRQNLEFNSTEDTRDEAYHYLSSHPDFWSVYGRQGNTNNLNTEATLQEARQYPLTSNFRHKTPSVTLTNKDLPYEGMHSHIELPLSAVGENGLVGSSSDGSGGELEEMEEPDYSRMQTHSITKHRRPPLQWTQQQQPWENRLQDPKNYAIPSTEDRHMYESGPQDPEAIGHDYDLQISDIDTSMADGARPSINGDFDPVMLRMGLRQRNERSGARDRTPNYLQAVPNKSDIFQTEKETFSFKRHLRRAALDKTKAKHRRKRVVNVKDSGDKADQGIHKHAGASPTPKGIYLLTSTGTLAPPLSGVGMDLVFVSYWIPPSEGVQILLPKEMECVQNELSRALHDVSGKFAGMDHETLETFITEQCLDAGKPGSPTSGPGSSSDIPIEPHPGFVAKASVPSPGGTNAYNTLNLKMGRLTLYRLNLQCQCEKVRSQHEKCASILPFEKQSWPSFMGYDGKGYFKPHH